MNLWDSNKINNTEIKLNWNPISYIAKGFRERINNAEKNNAFRGLLFRLIIFATIMKLIMVVALITEFGSPVIKENKIMSNKVMISLNLL